MSPIVALDQFQQFLAVNVLSDPGHIGGPIQVPLCMEVKLAWAQEDGKVANNVMHARYVGSYPGTASMAQAIMTAVTSAITSSGLVAQLATTTSLQQVLLRDINTPSNAYVSSVGGAVVGTGTAGTLPNEVAAVLTLRTAKVGQANRGRVYIPGFAGVALGAGNVISAAAMTALNNFAPLLRNAINNQGVTMCIAQPARNAYTGSTGTSHPARPAQTADVAQIVVRDNHWDSQRRRGLK